MLNPLWLLFPIVVWLKKNNLFTETDYTFSASYRKSRKDYHSRLTNETSCKKKEQFSQENGLRREKNLQKFCYTKKPPIYL